MAKIDKDKMKCNKPKRQVSGGKKFVVKACDKGKEKIEQIREEHLDNTEIDSVDKCEDYHDHYLLAKVDMAKEILETIIINKRK